MNSRNEEGLFGALEKELRKAKEPLDCVTLFEVGAVREHAETANRVSDYLGNLWRKGLVQRLPAPRIDGTRARWLYIWKDKGPKKKPPVDLSQAISFDEHVESIFTRPGLEVTEEGGTIVLTMKHVTITIKQR